VGIGAFLLFAPFSFLSSFPLHDSFGEDEELGKTCEADGLKQPAISLNAPSMTMIYKLLNGLFRTRDFKGLEILQIQRLQMLQSDIVSNYMYLYKKINYICKDYIYKDYIQ
jgi:hypothetical protein